LSSTVLFLYLGIKLAITPAVIIPVEISEEMYAAVSLHPVAPSTNIFQLDMNRNKPKTKIGIKPSRYFVYLNIINLLALSLHFNIE